MQKTMLYQKIGRLLCISPVFFFLFLKASGQVILRDQQIALKPEAFFIAGVKDERADRSTIGQLVVEGPGKKMVLRVTDLKEGAAMAICGFLRRNLPQNHALKPVEVTISELNVKETAHTGGGIDGRVRLSMSFDLQKNYGLEHLVNYQGSLQYTRYGTTNAAIEAYLRSILKSSLEYLNNWMKENTPVNRKLAENVKISFTDYAPALEGDTIYYSATRPLTWADFQSRAQPSAKFEAQVIPGIGYTQQAQMDKGTINVKITLKAYLPKSASRANFSGRDEYTLNHEQRHFDIAKIIAGQFKQKILAKTVTPDTFEAVINIQYLDSYRDLDTMQNAYDRETKHGTDRAAQAAWNSRIDNLLKL